MLRLTVTGSPSVDAPHQSVNVYYAVDAGGNGYKLKTTEVLVNGFTYCIEGEAEGHVITVTSVTQDNG